MNKLPLLNTFVNNLSMAETLSYIEDLILSKKKSYIVPINVDMVVKMEDDLLLKKIVDEATLTLVDGKPLIWISKIFNNPIKEKVSGSDLVPELCKIAAEKKYSIFIIGGAEGVALKAKVNLEREYNQINIVGTYSPPFGFEKNELELTKINSMISAVHPDIVVACFGCPKQEKWVYDNYRKYNGTVSICAGATVDFLAGNVKRAPKWMSNNGLEWLFRLVHEPRRLFTRYLVDDLAIVRITFSCLKKRV